MNWEIGLTSGMSHHENVAAKRILDQAWNNHGFGEHAVNFVQTQMCTKLGGNWHCVMIVSIPVVLQRDMSNFIKEICRPKDLEIEKKIQFGLYKVLCREKILPN